jgi:peptidoglycan/LPS O-acetylase OafA/YrhL
MVGVIAIIKMKFNKDDKWFMSKDFTQSMKAIMCIIVVMVHFPQVYQNKVQDMIGSFGYICVTLFFLFSAYGLMYGLHNKNDYLKTFIRNRFASLLIPYLIVNIISTIINQEWNNGIKQTMFSLLGLNINFVTLILFFYLVFYGICKIIKDNRVRYYILTICPLAYSLIAYLLTGSAGVEGIWSVEAIGFCLGILLFIHLEFIKKLITNKRVITIIISGILSTILGIVYLKYKTVFFIGGYLLKILLGVAIITFTFSVLNKLKIKNKALDYLGKISYEIFLTHGIVMTAISMIMTKINIEVTSWVYIWLTYIITIGLSAVINLLDQKIIKRIRK